jgi:predicted RNase H-like nuclease
MVSTLQSAAPQKVEAKTQTAVGIDGCRSGWIAAICRPDDSIEWLLRTTVQEILHDVPRNSIVLVDMIIGLPDRETPNRECDLLARKILSPHGSRVFPAPPREALAAEAYPEACELARAATGKAISKQCWYLFPKIRELDAISDSRIRESHPEVVFAQFNNAPVAASKKTMAGQNERLRLLRQVLPASIDAYLRADVALGQGDYLPDDCIDALALCLAAREPTKLQALHGGPRTPSIWY